MNNELEHGGAVVAEHDTESIGQQPPLYRVILLDDDYTPMDFVVLVLERFFGINRIDATRIMLDVHTNGRGVCGEFTMEIAETKVSEVNQFSRQHEHPLLCTMETTGSD